MWTLHHACMHASSHVARDVAGQGVAALRSVSRNPADGVLEHAPECPTQRPPSLHLKQGWQQLPPSILDITAYSTHARWQHHAFYMSRGPHKGPQAGPCTCVFALAVHPCMHPMHPIPYMHILLPLIPMTRNKLQSTEQSQSTKILAREQAGSATWANRCSV